jgi:hypothetical protein
MKFDDQNRLPASPLSFFHFTAENQHQITNPENLLPRPKTQDRKHRSVKSPPQNPHN